MLEFWSFDFFRLFCCLWKKGCDQKWWKTLIKKVLGVWKRYGEIKGKKVVKWQNFDFRFFSDFFVVYERRDIATWMSKNDAMDLCDTCENVEYVYKC